MGEIAIVSGYQVASSNAERLVAVLVSTGPGETFNMAMKPDEAIAMAEDLTRAGARLQDLKRRDI